MGNTQRTNSDDAVTVYDHRKNETHVPAGLLAREAAAAARFNLGYKQTANEGLAVNGEMIQPDAVLEPGARYELVMIGGEV